MNEDAGDLIIVVVEVLLFLQDVLGWDRRLRKESPNDDVAHLGACDDGTHVILNAG